MDASDLISKLGDCLSDAAKQAEGTQEAVWMPELFTAKTMDELYEMFDPQDANDSWDRIRQQKHRPFRKTMPPRRAVAFIAGIRRELSEHYGFDPVESFRSTLHTDNMNSRLSDIGAFVKEVS